MCNIEYWKDIEGFPKYKISSHGNILSFRQCPMYQYPFMGKAIGQLRGSFGYLCVRLYKDGQYSHCRIHRLVAQHFLLLPTNMISAEMDVHHKDGNKRNNCVLNLAWMDPIEHTKLSHKENPMWIHRWSGKKRILTKGHHSAAKLTTEQVYQIRMLQGHLLLKELGKIFNVHLSTISLIQNRKVWCELLDTPPQSFKFDIQQFLVQHK
jgi:hypothetical protein